MRELKSSGTLYGHLTVTVYDVKNGQKKRRFRISKKNQITNGGRAVVLALLAQDAAGAALQIDPTYNQIWSLAVGNDSTPVSVGDIALYGELTLGRYALTIPVEREYVIIPPTTYEIHIHKEIAAGLHDGETFAEAGLYTRGDDDDPTISVGQTLYARQIHPAFVKGAAMAVEYDWRLGMLVQ